MTPTPATPAHSTRWSLEVVRGRDVGRVFELPAARSSSATASTERAASTSATRKAARRGGWRRGRRCSRRRATNWSSATWTRRAGRSSIASACSPARPGASSPATRSSSAGSSSGWSRLPGPAARCDQPPPAGRQPPVPALGRLPRAVRDRRHASPAGPGTISSSWRPSGGGTSATSWPPAGSPTTSADPADRPAAPSGADRSLDEQLDQWLARLPVTQSSAPELDVHPDRLEVRPLRAARRARCCGSPTSAIVCCGARRGSSRPGRAGSGWLSARRPARSRPSRRRSYRSR